MNLREKLPLSAIIAALIAALGGFLFGYNTSVISGALLFLSQEFTLSPLSEGILVSTILLGALLGALVSGFAADRWGRKPTILLNGAIYALGILIVVTAESFSTLLLGRFISGIAVGLSSMLVPLYISEISPPQWRGALVALNQLMVTLGILSAYIVNYLCAAAGSWRWMFGMALIPTALQFCGMLFLQDAPKLSQEERHSKRKLSTIKYALLIGICLSIFQQVTGINAVIYYASKIFQMAGYANASSATFVSIGIGVVNTLATLISVRLLDRKGRRWLLLVGSVGMTLSLFLITLAFITNLKMMNVLAPLSLMVYVASFAISFGPVTWVLLSEIYPLELRGKAMSIATFVNWLCNYCVSLTFLKLVATLGTGATFALYAFFSLAAFFFIRRYIPETKGKSLEEIQKLLYT